LQSNEKLGELIVENFGDKNIQDSDIPLAMVATDVSGGGKVTWWRGCRKVPEKMSSKWELYMLVGVDLNAKHTFEKPDSILDVIIKSFHFLMQQSDKLQTEGADLLTKTDLSEFNRSEMNQVDDLKKI